MSDQPQTPGDRADDYVLGFLDASEAVALEGEMETDETLHAAVAASRDRFLELDLAGPVQPASPDLWARIEASLGRQDQLASAPPRIVQAGANDNRLSIWRNVAFAGIAASALMALALGYSAVDRLTPQVIAILVDDKGAPQVLVEDFGNARARITPLTDFAVPAEKSMQVWTLPNKEMGPTSLGLLDAWRTSVLDSPVLPRPHEEQLYEITIEQQGGSPTGRPTGPILVKGFAQVPR
ncbi:anti-sigma factor domain-containing protein [Rhizobium rhizogenes]|uniref:anti-sigma factor n=1 Tax=Rhizobium rhizogenes TaxID=359 RepID=UPI001572D782|nr:anti-sigma factor [Rhizobium rhizogenes]NTF44112.1 anti-sigma factor [Rhizobium rhizogenes]